jgi:hypothetical protein
VESRKSSRSRREAPCETPDSDGCERMAVSSPRTAAQVRHKTAQPAANAWNEASASPVRPRAFNSAFVVAIRVPVSLVPVYSGGSILRHDNAPGAQRSLVGARHCSGDSQMWSTRSPQPFQEPKCPNRNEGENENPSARKESWCKTCCHHSPPNRGYEAWPYVGASQFALEPAIYGRCCS